MMPRSKAFDERRVVWVLRSLPTAPDAWELEFWTRLSTSRLFVALDRLERTGIIRGEWDEYSDPSKRRYYLVGEKHRAYIDGASI